MHDLAIVFITLIICTFIILAFAVWIAVSLSAVLYWYEAANLQPELLDRRFKPSCWRRVLAIYAKEYVLTLLSFALYPFGLIRSRLPRFDRQKPILLLVHGLYLNRASCFYLHWRLKQSNHHIVSINLPPWRGLERLTECIDRTVSALHQQGFTGPIDLVGHSLGGIIARNYVQRRGGDQHIRHCITIAAPHYGSKIVPFALSELARQLSPRSQFIEQLSQSPWPQHVGFFSIFSPTDSIVLPPGRNRHEHATNIEVMHSGHTSLLYHHETYRHILDIVTTENNHD